jgi:hypothetical protein
VFKYSTQGAYFIDGDVYFNGGEWDDAVERSASLSAMSYAALATDLG